MSKKAQQWYFLTEDQLWRLSGTGTRRGAKEALEEVLKIKEAGGTPVIYYSQFNGFKIIDEDDPNQFRIALSIKTRAKRFSM